MFQEFKRKRMARRLRQYAKKHNNCEVYYNKKYHLWVHSGYPLTYSSTITETISDIICKAMVYPYMLNEVQYHEQDFSKVALIAYNTDKDFYIPEEFRKFYSSQEFEFLVLILEYKKKRVEDPINLFLERHKYKTATALGIPKDFFE